MNRRPLMVVVATLLLGVATLLPAVPEAYAAPPTNDEPAGATLLGPVPFHVEQDTTEATTSSEEAALNDFCGAPAFEHAVWFKATPTVEADVVVDVTASSYSA